MTQLHNVEGSTVRVIARGERSRSEQALHERESWFSSLLDALPAALYTTDAAGRITYYNEAAAEMWGCRPELGSSQWCGSWKLYWADGTPLPHDQCPMAVALKENVRIRGMEAIAERPDGTRIPFIPYPTPIHDASGALIGAVNMLVDITGRKRAEEHQAVLIRELHHRIKNTLATVQAIMELTARSSLTVSDFRQAFSGRLKSLANAHSILTDAVFEAVPLKQLLRVQLDAHDDGSTGRIRLNGPDVSISSDITVPIGMAIHELSTNAAKHGALSVPAGTVEVKWSVQIEASSNALVFQWIERDGPPVVQPSHEGFGSKLLEHVLTSQIGAQTTLAYKPEGLQARIVIPLQLKALSF